MSITQNASLVLTKDNSTGGLYVYVVNGGSGGTASSFSALFPLIGTAAGFQDTATGEMLPATVTGGALNVAGTFSSTPPTSSAASAVSQQTVGTTSSQVLASNLSRKGCAVKNTGTTTLYIGLGRTPTGSAYHIALPSSGASNDGFGGYWDGTISGVLWQGAVNIISSASGGTCVVTELT